MFDSFLFFFPATGSTWSKIALVLAIILAIAAYIFLKIYLKEPFFQLQKHSKEWCAKGALLEHKIVLPILGDIIWMLINILQFCLIIYSILFSFEMINHDFRLFLLFFIVYPIFLRIVFEIGPKLVIFLYKVFVKGWVALVTFYEWVIVVCGKKVSEAKAQESVQ